MARHGGVGRPNWRHGEAASAQRSTWRRCRSNAALRPSCPILPPRPPSTSSTSVLYQPVMREVVGLASTASPSKAWAAAKAASPPSSSAHGQAAKRQLQEEAPQVGPPPLPLAGRDSPRGTGGSLAPSLPALPHSLLTALPPLPNLVQDFVITAVSGSAAGPGAQAANAAPSEAAPGARTLPAAAPPAPPAPTISPTAVAQQSPPAVVEALSSGSPSPAALRPPQRCAPRRRRRQHGRPACTAPLLCRMRCAAWARWLRARQPMPCRRCPYWRTRRRWVLAGPICSCWAGGGSAAHVPAQLLFACRCACLVGSP